MPVLNGEGDVEMVENEIQLADGAGAADAHHSQPKLDAQLQHGDGTSMPSPSPPSPDNDPDVRQLRGIRVVLVSPLTRTLQTATGIFGAAISEPNENGNENKGEGGESDRVNVKFI